MVFQLYILLALLSAVLMGLYSVSIKILLRYRICSPVLITLGYCTAAGVISLLVVYSRGYSLDSTVLPFFVVATTTTLGGHLLLALAMQEADASTVVPLLGLKIPLTAILAFLFLGEKYPPVVYLAVIIAAGAVLLFGIGKPAKAQGGYGKNPVFGITLAVAASVIYSIGDIFIKKSLTITEPIPLILWINIALAVPCMGLLFLPTFRKYTIKAADILGLILCAVLVTGGIALYFASVKTSDSITTPNIILAMRSFIVLLVGFILNKILRIPIERQSNTIYLLRLAATCMLFASLVIILILK